VLVLFVEFRSWSLAASQPAVGRMRPVAVDRQLGRQRVAELAEKLLVLDAYA
jgi:hypothetical protein